jgi:C4-dicarboxylate-specific signal transduction histidine kinase
LLTELISETIFFAQPRLDNQNIKLTHQLPDKFYFKAQKISLSQVFINLIHNASDAIEHLNEKWIHIEGVVLEDQHLLRLKFIDSGSGLEKELVEKMMTPFFTTKEAGKGTGLGLSVCLGIIRDHGGQLYVDFDALHTTFVIDLPIVSASSS